MRGGVAATGVGAVGGPGVGLVWCAGAAGMAFLAGRLLPGLSPLLLAIVFGVAVSGFGLVPDAARPGLGFASRRLLRVGVGLLGLQLALTDILALGPGMLFVIVAVVVVGITTTLAVGRLLRVDARQTLLIACGFSICGAAAVAAVDGVVDAEEEEVAAAVGLVVVFGTVMIPAVPLLGGLLGLSGTQIGLWAGASIHEVAQVVAAAGTLGAGALGVAVVVKLGRVLMLGPVLAVVGYVERRRLSAAGASAARPPLVPWFVVGFLAMAALRTTGWVPAPVIDGVALVEGLLLAMAMFALGCGVQWRGVKALGVRPVALASVSTVVVALTALAGITLLG